MVPLDMVRLKYMKKSIQFKIEVTHVLVLLKPVSHSFVNLHNEKPVIPVCGDWLTDLHLSSFCTNLFTSTQIHRPLTEYE